MSKHLTTQLVVLILGTLGGLIGLVLSLAVWADWSDGAIVGMVSAFGTLATGLIVAVRNQQKTQETLQGQGEQLATIEKQTNGLSSTERQDIAERAAAAAIARIQGERGCPTSPMCSRSTWWRSSPIRSSCSRPARPRTPRTR